MFFSPLKRITPTVCRYCTKVYTVKAERATPDHTYKPQSIYTHTHTHRHSALIEPEARWYISQKSLTLTHTYNRQEHGETSKMHNQRHIFLKNELSTPTTKGKKKKLL